MTDQAAETTEDYFFEVVTAVFDDFFEHLGASRESTENISPIRYSTDRWFVEILFLPYDGPDYLPRVETGCLPERFIDPRRNRIDVLHTAPEGSEEYDYNLRWRYKSRSELITSLVAVRDRILRVHTLPFLKNTTRLQELMEQRCVALDSAWSKEIDEHNDSIWRTNAERAFKSKNYEAAIEQYNRISPARRSKLDEAKLLFAKSRLS